MKENKTTTSAQEFSNVYLCLTQCSSVDTLPFLCEWEHAKVGTFQVLLPELHLWTEPILVSRISFQPHIRVFSSFRCWNIWAMHGSLAHHSSLASIVVIAPLISKIVPPAAHTHGPTLCPTTTTGPQYGAIRLYAPLPFPHTEMQICGFLTVLPLQSLSYTQHLPSQVRQVCW